MRHHNTSQNAKIRNFYEIFINWSSHINFVGKEGCEFLSRHSILHGNHWN